MKLGRREPGEAGGADFEWREMLVARASQLRANGHYAKSLAEVNRALAQVPDQPGFLSARALTLFSWRRCREARDLCIRAKALGLRGTSLFLVLGWSSFALGEVMAAEGAMRDAVAADSGAFEPHFNLAVVLQARKLVDEAAASYARALEIRPVDFDCLMGLGVVRLGQREPGAGEALFRQAIALDQARSAPWTHLGAALVLQCRYGEALEAFAHADSLVRDGDNNDNFVDLANLLAESHRSDEALQTFERNLPGRPSAGAYYAYALTLLRAGRLIEGFRYYEFRWLRETLPVARDDFHRPAWAGQDLAGRTVLLHVEQGFGDLVQFIRYAPLVKAQGAKVILRVSRPMKKLARGFPGVDRIVDRDDALPEFDYLSYLLSLPRLFGTDVRAIPAQIPYLRGDPDSDAHWARRFEGEKRPQIGLAWAGSPAHANDLFRSMQLSQLRPVLEVGGVRFVSLQKGAGAEQATDAVPAGVDWLDLGPELADFTDTAAVIAQLDLVICVDTAVAHLAGALGKPVWVMLPEPADFRWLEGREDSPWYPTLRLFRQSRRDEWGDVVERVAAALQERVRNGAPPPDVKPKVEVAPTIGLPWTSPAQLNAGHRAGMSAVAETRTGIMQYLPDEPIVGDAIGWYGEYLQPQLELLARIVRPGGTMLEAGAGVGEHAIYLGRVLGEAGHLMLYEARPVQQRILRQNLAANGVGNVTVMRRTLGSRSEEQDVAASVPPSHETLDELQLERLDWLKVGASGDALDILAGASETLWRLRPFLFLAARDEEALREQAERAREFGYRCWRMEMALFEPTNFNRRETDIFAGAKALALLAIPEEIEVDVALDRCTEISWT